MERENPFSSISDVKLSAIVKNLEKRWGLALVSFLPPEAQQKIVKLQIEISSLGNTYLGESSIRQVRHFVDFYEPEQFHCTHLTLLRSDPSGPVRVSDIQKDGEEFFCLYKEIHKLTAKIQPIKVILNQLRIAKDGLGIILLGECAGDDAIKNRGILLDELNYSLPKSFAVSMRSWDSDPSKFHKVHCSLGYVKRIPPQGYNEFVEQIENTHFSPIVLDLEIVTLVHHRYRTLAFPQEGYVNFQLGSKLGLTEDEFTNQINIH